VGTVNLFIAEQVAAVPVTSYTLFTQKNGDICDVIVHARSERSLLSGCCERSN